MKFGHFKGLALKKEKQKLNNKGLFLKSETMNIKYRLEKENKAMFIIKKKTGNSPKRNKLKRQLRAILSKIEYPKMHLMIIAKKEIANESFQNLEKEICEIIKQIKEIENNKTIKKQKY